MNVGSDAQKAHFLFAPTQRVRRGRKAVVDEDKDTWPQDRAFKVDNVEGYIVPGKTKPLKQRDITLRGLGMNSPVRTAAGWPAVSGVVLRELAGDVEGNPMRAACRIVELIGSRTCRSGSTRIRHCV